MLFQLVQIEVDREGDVVATTRTLPLFDRVDDAQARAEFLAAHSGADHAYDAAQDCWWARDNDERTLIFIVRPVTIVGLETAA
jgi:hypothetical protein